MVRRATYAIFGGITVNWARVLMAYYSAAVALHRSTMIYCHYWTRVFVWAGISFEREMFTEQGPPPLGASSMRKMGISIDQIQEQPDEPMQKDPHHSPRQYFHDYQHAPAGGGERQASPRWTSEQVTAQGAWGQGHDYGQSSWGEGQDLLRRANGARTVLIQERKDPLSILHRRVIRTIIRPFMRSSGAP